MFIENKKGFTLVEVICSLGVFSIIFSCIMSYEVASLKMKKDIKNINNNVIIMENLKNNIIYDMTFNELYILNTQDNILNTQDNIYINKNNITLDENKMMNNAVFTNIKPELSPYMKLTVLNLELNVYKLNLSLYSGNPNDVLELECNFYKGDHK